MKTVYTCFTTDVIHEGHRNIIAQARKYGAVTVGVLSDEAMICFNRFPTISFEERMALVKGMEGVSQVVVQESILYNDIIQKLHPDYVIHGDSWNTGPMKVIRDNVASLLNAYGGKIVDVPYTYSEEVSRIDRRMRERAAMPEFRRKRLWQLLKLRSVVKAIEVHSGLTGLIAEKTIVENGGVFDQFDTMWVSSLCDSTAKGKPDIELVDMSSRLRTIDEIMEVTTKPIILDGDTGGLAEYFMYNVRTLERMGVSAVIIEDKKGAEEKQPLRR